MQPPNITFANIKLQPDLAQIAKFNDRQYFRIYGMSAPSPMQTSYLLYFGPIHLKKQDICCDYMHTYIKHTQVTYIHTYMHIYIHTYVHNVHSHTHTYIHTYVHTYMYTNIILTNIFDIGLSFHHLYVPTFSLELSLFSFPSL